MGFATRDGIDFNELWYGAIAAAHRMYNEATIDIPGLLASPTGEAKINLFYEGTGDFTELAEVDEPLTHDIAKGQFTPIPVFRGLATGFTWKYLVEAKSEDVLERQRQGQMKDRNFQRKNAVAAIMKKPTTANDTFGLWDGTFQTNEGITAPPTYGILSFAAAHTHYYATGNPTASGVLLSDLITAKKHIREHGIFGDLVCFMSEKQISQLERIALPIWEKAPAGFSENLNKSKIANDFSNEVLRSGFAGRLLGVNIVNTPFMPDEYFVVAATNTPQGKGMFLQEKTNPVAKGLILFPGKALAEYPITNSRYFRWNRYGVLNRGFAVSVMIQTGSTYVNPPDYADFDL